MLGVVYFRWLGRRGFGGILTSRDLPWDVGYRVCELDSYQVVIWSDSEELSEVAECHWGVRLEAEVWVVVGWSQIAAFTGVERQREITRERERQRDITRDREGER